MQHSSPAKTLVMFIALVTAVVVLSTLSIQLWAGKPEKMQNNSALTITAEMTVSEFGQANEIPNPALKEIFGLQQRSDLQKKLSEFGTAESIEAQVLKKKALASEHESKNWQKILVKFIAWFGFLVTIFVLFRKTRVTSQKRNIVLLSSVMIFGVLLGSDPSPMGTVKDAIHLYATTGAIFPPRLIALSVFLLVVFLANKFICSWGCQLGTLQDLLFRLNQNEKYMSIIGTQMKVPFVISNSIRISFLFLFTVVAVSLGADIIEPLDPFKIFNPIHLGITGGVFVGLLFVTSLFIYRPWCHLFCPFGLVGWLVEKKSRVKVSVDYTTCIGCQKCAEACPTTVMNAILKQDRKTIPDCFSCYACRDICPTQSIEFSARQRTLPPPNHFAGDNNKGHLE